MRFYSDDHPDHHTLTWRDEPIAVNPSRKLRRLATERGWAILNWQG
ncbi:MULTISPECIES: hypothetical protein [Sphingomonadaceae]|nr:hypothetical protein [Novosphingobium sp. EMRT-2]